MASPTTIGEQYTGNRRTEAEELPVVNGPEMLKVDGKCVVLPKVGLMTVVEELRIQDSIQAGLIINYGRHAAIGASGDAANVGLGR